MKKLSKIILMISIPLFIIFYMVLVMEWDFIMPVKGATYKSYSQDSFWYYPWGVSGHHKGVDIFAKEGTEVVSATNGIVIYTGVLSLGGNVVLVLSGGWHAHYYAHLSKINTHMFALVSKGDPIGLVGTTGNAKGKPPHLHYSIGNFFPRATSHQMFPTQKEFYLNPIPLLNRATNMKKNNNE